MINVSKVTIRESHLPVLCTKCRLVTWAEINGLITDEQNGFRRGRSTLDPLSSLTSIIETGKRKRLDTYVAFKNALSNKMLQALQVIYSNVR